jgi:hypothetical protein
VRSSISAHCKYAAATLAVTMTGYVLIARHRPIALDDARPAGG